MKHLFAITCATVCMIVSSCTEKETYYTVQEVYRIVNQSSHSIAMDEYGVLFEGFHIDAASVFEFSPRTSKLRIFPIFILLDDL